MPPRKPPSKKNPATPSPLQDTLLDDTGKLGLVRARFEGFEKGSFEDLISDYSSLRVLTYSSSIPIINRAAERMDSLEVVFGRADILGVSLSPGGLLKALARLFRGK